MPSRMLQRISKLGGPPVSLFRKARHDSNPFRFYLFQASLSAGQSLRSGSRPLSAYSVRQLGASSMGLRRVMGSRYDTLFWAKECIKLSTPFAVKMSKKEIQRPIQGPLGAA